MLLLMMMLLLLLLLMMMMMMITSMFTLAEGFPVVTNQEEMLVVGYVTREMMIKALTKARTQLGLGDNCRVFFTNDIPVSRDAPLFDLRSLPRVMFWHAVKCFANRLRLARDMWH